MIPTEEKQTRLISLQPQFQVLDFINFNLEWNTSLLPHSRFWRQKDHISRKPGGGILEGFTPNRPDCGTS